MPCVWAALILLASTISLAPLNALEGRKRMPRPALITGMILIIGLTAGIVKSLNAQELDLKREQELHRNQAAIFTPGVEGPFNLVATVGDFTANYTQTDPSGSGTFNVFRKQQSSKLEKEDRLLPYQSGTVTISSDESNQI
jgi:hypothetical protein